MWLMMGIEQPGIAAIVARLPDAELNLAAFGVIMSVALVIESPILQMLSAATALAASREHYRRLLHFMHGLASLLTSIHLIVALTPLFDVVLGGVLGVPENIVEQSRLPFLCMAPFAAAVGYRRLWQGTLIRYGRTAVVPVTMIARVITTASVLAVGLATRGASGALVGALALSLGVIAGAVSAWLFCRKLIREEIPEEHPDQETFSYRDLLRFYVPLSMTSIIFLLSRPLLTFGMARAAFPVKSLAVWPVINGLMFLFNSVALSFQEAVIALMERNPENRRPLSFFALWVALALSGMFLITAVTPLRAAWFQGVSGLSDALLPFTRVPVLILTVVPAMLTLKSWLRGRYVHHKRTGVMAYAVAVYTVFLAVGVSAGAAFLAVPGAVLAAVCMSAAQLVENGYLVLANPNRAGSVRA